MTFLETLAQFRDSENKNCIQFSAKHWQSKHWQFFEIFSKFLKNKFYIYYKNIDKTKWTRRQNRFLFVVRIVTTEFFHSLCDFHELFIPTYFNPSLMTLISSPLKIDAQDRIHCSMVTFSAPTSIYFFISQLAYLFLKIANTLQSNGCVIAVLFFGRFNII